MRRLRLRHYMSVYNSRIKLNKVTCFYRRRKIIFILLTHTLKTIQINKFLLILFSFWLPSLNILIKALKPFINYTLSVFVIFFCVIKFKSLINF